MVKQGSGIVWAGARLRVPLETEGGPVGAVDALQAAVEQRPVRGTNPIRQAALVHRETVILAGDHDLARGQVDPVFIEEIEELPETGYESGRLAVFGLLTLGLGALLVGATRRRDEDETA